MRRRVITVIVLVSSAISVPALSQPLANLDPVAPGEVSRFIGRELLGRGFSRIGIVSEADRTNGTIMIVGSNGVVATLPNSLLGRNGLQLRAPAVSIADVARASFGGKSRIPLQGEVLVTSDVE
jgi:hypothetical protein